MSMGISKGKAEEYGMDEAKYWKLRNIYDSQSIALVCEILPYIYRLFPEGRHALSLVDVGARTGAGTGLIGYLHQEYAYNRIKIRATAMDVDGQYVKYASAHYPFIKYVINDIYKMDPAMRFDLVLCSHTIEHVPGPDRFVDRLREMANMWIILACPFEENQLIEGHVNRLDMAFFERHSAVSVDVFSSVAWTRSKACVAILPPK